MEFIKKIEENYITQFVPEFFEMKFMRDLKLPFLPNQKEFSENEAAIKLQHWFRSDLVRKNLYNKKIIKEQKNKIVRKSTAIML